MKTSISLIGMSGCGKTVVGRRVARLLDMRFFDADAEIEQEQGVKISEIFEKSGEAEFRRLEREKTAELAKLHNVVISTGGGVILDAENMENLKRNSVIVFLDRSVSDILAKLDNSNRPVLKDKSKFHKIYDERIALYRKYADIIVENIGTVDDVAERVANEWRKYDENSGN